MKISIEIDESGQISVGEEAEGAMMGGESGMKPAASIDEALAMARQMLQAGQSPDRADIAKQVFGQEQQAEPGQLNRKPNMGGGY
jgi:hypothetical protein